MKPSTFAAVAAVGLSSPVLGRYGDTQDMYGHTLTYDRPPTACSEHCVKRVVEQKDCNPLDQLCYCSVPYGHLAQECVIAECSQEDYYVTNDTEIVEAYSKTSTIEPGCFPDAEGDYEKPTWCPPEYMIPPETLASLAPRGLADSPVETNSAVSTTAVPSIEASSTGVPGTNGSCRSTSATGPAATTTKPATVPHSGSSMVNAGMVSVGLASIAAMLFLIEHSIADRQMIHR
ncbi:hypothetical protein ACLX1H_000773 [Fusarium chlamydosporum]